MGKAGRIACIFTPMALTIASFICLVLVEVSGWNGNLGSYYFFQANLTNLTIPTDSSDQTLTLAIQDAKDHLADIYQIHLWNYCYSNSSSDHVDNCSKRESEFVFNPVDIWGLNVTNTTATSTSSADNAVESAIHSVKENASELEEELLGKSAKEALDAYRTAAKWMWIAYQVSFWTTLATIVVGILAIFSRWGSFLTWIFSSLSTLFTFGAVLTSTILFAILVETLNESLKDYGIKLKLGENVMVVNWLGVAFSVSSTSFWLFSICCCSGRSNPHHRSNKGGLWSAEPKGQGYDLDSRGRGPKVEKTGGGYERVASPYLGAHHDHDDQVPLHDYAQPSPFSNHQQGAGYEPYRHT